MKHLFVLIVLAIGGYTVWQFASPIERRHAMRVVGRHGVKIAAIVALLMLMLAASYYLMSSPIL